jgi:hypothetical protein
MPPNRPSAKRWTSSASPMAAITPASPSISGTSVPCSGGGIGSGRRNRLREAEPLFQEALAMERSLWGEQHPEFAYSLNNLGRVMRGLGKADSATVLLTRALQIREESFGREHPEVAVSLHARGARCGPRELPPRPRALRGGAGHPAPRPPAGTWRYRRQPPRPRGFLVRQEAAHPAEPLLPRRWRSWRACWITGTRIWSRRARSSAVFATRGGDRNAWYRAGAAPQAAGREGCSGESRKPRAPVAGPGRVSRGGVVIPA